MCARLPVHLGDERRHDHLRGSDASSQNRDPAPVPHHLGLVGLVYYESQRRASRWFVNAVRREARWCRVAL
jgi:hypothetical protein